MDAEALLTRVKRGESLTPDDMASVRAMLRQTEPPEDPYTLLHIVRLRGDTRDVDVVLPWLTFRADDPCDDGLVRRIALQALAALSPREAFGHARRMLETDRSKYVRLIAATVVGDLGHDVAEFGPAAATVLLDRFRELEKARDRDLEWEASYEGLLNLIGIAVHDRLSLAKTLTPADVRTDVIARAERLAAGS